LNWHVRGAVNQQKAKDRRKQEERKIAAALAGKKINE
jgi:hypothetical protein